MLQNYDIAITGGGPVGLALALALRDSGLSVVVLEARKAQDAGQDPRALALSYGSRLLLEQLGVWQQLPQVSAINTIHVSQQHTFGRTLLNAPDLKVPALGYVLPYTALHAALQQALENTKIRFMQGAMVDALVPHDTYAELKYSFEGEQHALQAQLVVVADGGKLLEASHPPTTHDYGQSALIAHITCSAPAADTAFERFTPQGPLALLPYRDGYELVWTTPDAGLEALLALDDASLLTRLHEHFGGRVGEFLSIGKRSSFPLRLKRAPTTTLPHTVLIGNAAQTLHPVAGQGFNMGLRDAWTLARQILRQQQVLGSPGMLQAYRNARSADRNAGITFTDGLVRLFSNDLPLLGGCRSASLSLLDCLPSVKKFVARRMMLGA